MKKLVAILLVLVMLFSFAPMAFADGPSAKEVTLCGTQMNKENEGKYVLSDENGLCPMPLQDSITGYESYGWAMYQDGVLTLNNFNGCNNPIDEYEKFLSVKGLDLTIVLQGFNMADTYEFVGTDLFHGKNGIVAENNTITIKGDGHFTGYFELQGIVAKELILDESFEGAIDLCSAGIKDPAGTPEYLPNAKLQTLKVNNGIIELESDYAGNEIENFTMNDGDAYFVCAGDGINKIGEINFNNGSLCLDSWNGIPMKANRIVLGENCFIEATKEYSDDGENETSVYVPYNEADNDDYEIVHFYYDDTVSPETGVNDTLVLLSIMLLSVIIFAVSRKVRKN